jgi:hypothetical protein
MNASQVLAAPIITLMMETANTSETVNFYQTTYHYNPENSKLVHMAAMLVLLITKIKKEQRLRSTQCSDINMV